MKILYGVQGTGNGHLSRARVIAKALAEKAISVDYLFSGRPAEDYFSMENFGNYQTRKGLTFYSQQGKIQLLSTLTKNHPSQALFDIRELNCQAYDLIISDFEPITAWAAKRAKKPSLSISHQSAFRYNVPKAKGYLGAKAIMRLFAPTDYHFGLHWHHFNQPILPPVIDSMQPATSTAGKIIVYMGFEALDDILHLIKPFTQADFHVYAKVNQAQQIGNIYIKPLSHQGFHKDLLDCQGVIANAGFELASEAISLGKKILVKPLLGQYEQQCNAKALTQLGYGVSMQKLDRGVLQQWLNSPSTIVNAYPDVAGAIANHISQGLWHDNQSLAKQLWA